MKSIPLKKIITVFALAVSSLLCTKQVYSQVNFLLNGDFEDINTCSEYDSECGVEAWFYLKDIKAQMISNEAADSSMGANSFGLFFNWMGYTGFSPLMGTLLPCRLQKDNQYLFKGMIKVRLNGKLDFKPGIALGEKFYVPFRPFSKEIHPDSIVSIKKIAGSDFYEFEYSFRATGDEKYLTFGTYIHEDTTAGKKLFIGTQSIQLVLDNFKLIPLSGNETPCNAFEKYKRRIYQYNFRHKEMDYSLFGKGELKIPVDDADSNLITRTAPLPVQPITAHPDTLKIGDVFFDSNKAGLKPAALNMLHNFFAAENTARPIDSLYIEGHTDSIGTDEDNQALSLQRCESIRNWLLANTKLEAGQMQVHPFGESRPIAGNSTEEGRAMNRRVELIIFRKRWK